MTSARDRIRMLNDELRVHHRGGNIVLTSGVSALPAETIQRIDQALVSFHAFTADNDPYGEHDFGTLTVAGHRVLFKIDYYDLTLSHHSPDPSNPEVTRRVLTLMLPAEY